MTKLKTILQSKAFIIIILLLLIIRVCIYYFINTESNYNKGFITIEGEVLNVKEKNNNLTIVLKEKEKIVGYYNNIDNIDIKEKDIIKIYGLLDFPTNNTIPNTFNYKEYLNNQKIYTTINIKSIEIIKKSKGIYEIKRNIQKKIQSSSNNPYTEAMIIGNTSNLDMNNIRNVGISHLFAISGLHVSIIVKILNTLLKPLKKHKKYIITIFLLLYSFIVNYTASVLRAVLTWIIKSLEIGISSKLIYFYVLVITLIFKPQDLTNIGFQYSFTIGFVFLYKTKRKNTLINILESSLWCFLASTPITAYNYYEINILSIIWNIVFIPIITFIMYPAIILNLLLPFITPIITLIIKTFEFFIQTLSTIPFGTIIIPKINTIFWIIYYILIYLYISKNNKFLYLIIFLILTTQLSKYFNNETKITFLDVGQGDSILYTNGYDTNYLIDTGGNNQASQKTIQYMHSLGIAKLNYLTLTHGDYDHMGEAINLINNFKVEKVIFNCGPYNDLENELIKVLDKKKIPYYSCIKELNINKNKLYFLQTKDYDNENDFSNVIFTELDGYKFMFMGDASSTTEKEILSNYNIPNIDVLKVGHHGSKTSSSIEFINKISPRYSIISVGKNNRYGHPNKEVLVNLKDSKIYRTDEEGSIMFKIKNSKLRIETCSP